MFQTKFLDFYVTTNAFISSVTTAHIVRSVFVKFQMTHVKFCLCTIVILPILFIQVSLFRTANYVKTCLCS